MNKFDSRAPAGASGESRFSTLKARSISVDGRDVVEYQLDRTTAYGDLNEQLFVPQEAVKSMGEDYAAECALMVMHDAMSRRVLQMSLTDLRRKAARDRGSAEPCGSAPADKPRRLPAEDPGILLFQARR